MERKSTVYPSNERAIIDWILTCRRGYTVDRIRQLCGENEVDASAYYGSGQYYARAIQPNYYPNPNAYPNPSQPQEWYQAQWPDSYSYPYVEPSPQPDVPQQKSESTTIRGAIGQVAASMFNFAQSRAPEVAQEAPCSKPVPAVASPANRKASERSPFEEPSMAATAQPIASKSSSDVSPKRVAETSSEELAEEYTPSTTPKIEVLNKNMIQISLGGEIIGKYLYEAGLWTPIVENATYLHMSPLEAHHEEISFELGGINFKVYLNGDIEVFGSTPVRRCVLECPSEGKLIIPEEKTLQVNRFVCMTRGKTIENRGTVEVAEACFCFEQKIINRGKITATTQPGKLRGVLLLLQSDVISDGGVEDIMTIHLKDRSYPEYGCCCFYGFDRSLYPVCTYSNYPDPKVTPDVFVNLPDRNFFYLRSEMYIPVPFNGRTSEGDFCLPFTGNAMGVFIGNGNYNHVSWPETAFKFKFLDSPSNRPFAFCTGVEYMQVP